MQLPYILTVALLALGAVAAPSLEERTWNKNSCKDGQKWNDYKKSCECPPKQQYISHKCRYPPIPEPHCPWGQKSYCSNKNDWGLYHKSKDYCGDDGQNIAWCCEHKNKDKCFKDKYPPEVPQCPEGQKYNPHKKECACEDPKYWNDKDKKCHYPPLPEPQCPSNDWPWCGKGKKSYSKYDKFSKWCENDGESSTWCAPEWDLGKMLEGLFDLD